MIMFSFATNLFVVKIQTIIVNDCDHVHLKHTNYDDNYIFLKSKQILYNIKIGTIFSLLQSF